jgi:hypothetical protein
MNGVTVARHCRTCRPVTAQRKSSLRRAGYDLQDASLLVSIRVAFDSSQAHWPTRNRLVRFFVSGSIVLEAGAVRVRAEADSFARELWCNR